MKRYGYDLTEKGEFVKDTPTPTTAVKKEAKKMNDEEDTKPGTERARLEDKVDRVLAIVSDALAPKPKTFEEEVSAEFKVTPTGSIRLVTHGPFWSRLLAIGWRKASTDQKVSVLRCRFGKPCGDCLRGDLVSSPLPLRSVGRGKCRKVTSMSCGRRFHELENTFVGIRFRTEKDSAEMSWCICEMRKTLERIAQEKKE